MGILKKIGKGIRTGEKKYERLKKDTVEIRRVGGKIFDFIIPPQKKGGKQKVIRAKMCQCPKKRKK